MRQTGIIAAAGIVALEKMMKRLVDDHANAHRLAVGIAGISGLKVDLENVRTNIIVFSLENNNGLTEDDFMTRLEEKGVKFLSRGSCQFRMVTHHGITAEDIDLVVEILKDVVG